MIPVSLVTGFLGSGKTTLISRLLRDPAFGRTAVIVNEFGEISLDHDLIASMDDSVLTLNTGCLCCAVQTDLARTLLSLLEKRETGEAVYDRVLIETSGLADPGSMLQAVMTDDVVAATHRIASIVTIVDTVHGAYVLEQHEAARRQVVLADRVLISKTDVQPASEALLARLEALNPGAVPGPSSPAQASETKAGEKEEAAETEEEGLAEAEDDGTAEAEDNGTAEAEDDGTAEAKDDGTATAEDDGPAEAEDDGTAKAEDDGTAAPPFPIVMAGLVPAIHAPAVEARMAGTRPAMTIEGAARPRPQTGPDVNTVPFSPATLFAETSIEDLARRLASLPPFPGHRDIDSFTLTRDRPIPALALTLLLEAIAEHCGERLLRLKGLVALEEMPGQPAVIHGVRHVVSAPVFPGRWPSDDETTRIVFITQGVPRHFPSRLLDAIEEEVREELAAREG